MWEYFDLQGPWQKVLTDLKKSLYAIQADPEKSRDLIFKNPRILINWKSRDPARSCCWLKSSNTGCNIISVTIKEFSQLCSFSRIIPEMESSLPDPPCSTFSPSTTPTTTLTSTPSTSPTSPFHFPSPLNSSQSTTSRYCSWFPIPCIALVWLSRRRQTVLFWKSTNCI